MSKLSFDQIIKKALGEIDQKETQVTPPPFESMSRQIEAEKFDDFIKEELESLEPKSPSAWEEFEDAHAQAIGHKHPIDQVVTQQMGTSSESPSTVDWANISAELSRQIINERRVLIGKGVELSIMLLVFWWMVGLFFPRGNSLGPEVSESVTAVDGAISEKKEIEKNNDFEKGKNSTTEILSLEDNLSSLIPSTYGIDAMTLTEGVSLRSEENKRTVTQSRISLSSRFADQKVRNSTQGSPTESHDEEKEATKQVLTITPKGPTRGEGLAEAYSIGLTKYEEAGDIGFSKAPSLMNTVPASLLLFNAQFNEFDVPLDQLRGAEIQNKYKRSFISSVRPKEDKNKESEKINSIAFSSGWQINQIATEADPFYPVPATTSFSHNLTIGLEWQERNGNNAFGLSANYQHWNYSAPRFEELYQTSSDEELHFITLEAMTFDMLSFQLFGRKYFSLPRQLEGFVHFGGGLRLSLHSQYDIKEGRFESGGNNTPELTEEELAALPSRPRLWNKSFQEGLFEGGGINENSFMTLNFGGGVAYKYNDKWQIEFMPLFSLSPFTDGLGPNRDKINSLILQFQLRRTLQ
jgi:hypothetical protein